MEYKPYLSLFSLLNFSNGNQLLEWNKAIIPEFYENRAYLNFDKRIMKDIFKVSKKTKIMKRMKINIIITISGSPVASCQVIVLANN